MLKPNQGTLSSSHFKLLSALKHFKKFEKVEPISSAEMDLSLCELFPFSVMAGNKENFAQWHLDFNLIQVNCTLSKHATFTTC